jgi:uncharacterized protein (UPF0332 family)
VTEQGREESVQAELRRAEQTLRAADGLVDLGLWNDAVNRAHYAAYHAACAMLVRLGLQARTHRGVHSLVTKHLVEPGHLAPENLTRLARLARLEERRSVADYRAAEDIEASQAKALVEDARTFLDAARAVASKPAPP